MNKRKIGVYTGGDLLELKAKMAHGVIRYREDVCVVIDHKHFGKKLSSLVPYVGKDIPIVRDFRTALDYDIEELLLGIAPPGGVLPESYIADIKSALDHGVRIANGSHQRLAMNEQFRMHSKNILDIRYCNLLDCIASGKASELKNNVVLTIGSDCASGKMTTALELYLGCLKRNLKSDFIPTGQTGMYIMDKGFAIDSVISDFMAGNVEYHVLESARKSDFIFIEGQGAIIHPAYSGVSLALLHGAAPNLIIFSHDISRKKLEYFNKDITNLKIQMDLVEELGKINRECKVVGVSLFANGYNSYQIQEIIDKMEGEYGIPVFAPLVTGVEKMIDLLEEFK